MFNFVPVSRVAVFLLALVIHGVKVKGEETIGDSESQSKEASSGQDVEHVASSDNWIVNLTWNLLGYATIIIPAAFIIRMLKNSNFNERSGKMFVQFLQRVPFTSLIITSINYSSI